MTKPTLSEIAAKIDAMNLAELLSEASKQDLPLAGEDYDTKEGWQQRMGAGKSAARNAISMLLKSGLAKVERGQVKTASGYTTVDLIHCPTLAKKCG